MKKEFYDKLARPFETDEKRKLRLVKVNSVITGAVYLFYPAMLAVLAVLRDKLFFRTLLVPLVTFAAVTVFRKVCNAPRPYEVWDSPPLIPKDTKGHSFPSRHVFSVYIIAMAALYVGISSETAHAAGIGVLSGVLLLVIGVFLAAVRVIARVHFLKDVICGAALGIALGYIGFYII